MNPFHRIILEETRKLVADEKEMWYLCLNIEQVSQELGHSDGIMIQAYREAGADLLRAIHELINHQSTYYRWLRYNQGYERFDVDLSLMRQARLAWIDYMLENW